MNTTQSKPHKSQTAQILHRRSNTALYEDAKTRGSIPREFVTVNLIDGKVTLIKGFVVLLQNNVDVFWQPNGRCYNKKTLQRVRPGDLLIREVQP